MNYEIWKEKNMPKILVINGNPKQISLCKFLAEVYTKTCKSYNKSIETIHLCDLGFDMNLIEGYHSNQYVE